MGGEFGPGRLHVAPPGQRSSSSSDVSMMFASMGCSCLVVACLVVMPLFSICDWNVVEAYEDRLSAGPKPFGVFALCLALCLVLRFQGRFPWWGGLRTPRYYGPLGCLPKRAGRPMRPRHPAVTISLRLCFLGVVFVRCLLDLRMYGLCGFYWSLGSRCCLVWCPSRPAPCSHWCL